MVDLIDYAQLTKKSTNEIYKMWKDAITISIEDKGKYDEPYAEGVLRKMLKLGESKILDLQTRFLENKKISIKELFDDYLKEDGEVNAQPSTSFNINPGGGGIVPPNEDKDKEFDKNLNENIYSDLKDAWEDLENNGEQALMADYTKALGNKIVSSMIDAYYKEMSYKDWYEKIGRKLSVYESKIKEIISPEDPGVSKIPIWREKYSVIRKNIEEKLSVGDTVPYNGNNYKIVGFEDSGTEKVRIKNTNTGEEKIVVKRAFESVMKESDPSLKAPKEWWSKMEDKIRKEDVDDPAAVIGEIWSNLSASKKAEIRGRYGKTYGPAPKNEAIDGEVVVDSDVPYYTNGLEPIDMNDLEDFEKPLAEKKSK